MFGNRPFVSTGLFPFIFKFALKQPTQWSHTVFHRKKRASAKKKFRHKSFWLEICTQLHKK